MKEWMKPRVSCLSWRVAAKDWTRQAEPPFQRFCCWPQPEPETNSWCSLDSWPNSWDTKLSIWRQTQCLSWLMTADCLEVKARAHWTRQVEPISTVVAGVSRGLKQVLSWYSLLNNRINFTEGWRVAAFTTLQLPCQISFRSRLGLTMGCRISRRRTAQVERIPFSSGIRGLAQLTRVHGMFFFTRQILKPAQQISTPEKVSTYLWYKYLKYTQTWKLLGHSCRHVCIFKFPTRSLAVDCFQDMLLPLPASNLDGPKTAQTEAGNDSEWHIKTNSCSRSVATRSQPLSLADTFPPSGDGPALRIKCRTGNQSGDRGSYRWAQLLDLSDIPRIIISKGGI